MNIKLKYPQQFKKQHKSRKNFFYKKTLLNLDTSSFTSFFEKKRIALFTNQPIVLPKKIISFLRKFLRKFFKKRKIKCWLNLQPNRIITSKSKNSRMGRGVGSINRTAFLVLPIKPLFIFANVSQKRVNFLVRLLKSRLPIQLFSTRL